ncbi:MAG: AMP-binding protein, partial [Kordiimonadaceae bacterium]|nr:AMP-binding protein [Kordiimonadaceae bacterium]
RFIDLGNKVSFSYQDVVNASNRIAALLLDKGIKPKDVVATYAPNSVAAYCCIFAISRVGAVWLPLNARNTPESNLKLLKKSVTSLLFVDETIAAGVPELESHIPEGRCIVFTGQSIDGEALQSFAFEPVDCSEGDSEQAGDEQATISLLSTGGTTGDSKLAEWSSLTWQTMASIQMSLMPQPDIPVCYLVSSPMSHAAGVASFVPMLQGATILVMDGLMPEVLLPAIQAYKVTHLFLPPTAIYMLLNHKDVMSFDYSSLRYFWYAAAPMSADKLQEAIQVFGPVMIQTYGQAEAPMVCTCLSTQDHVEALKEENSARLRSCGKIAPDVELAIVDADGNFLPSGQEGEIVVKGGLLMSRYYNDPAETAAIRMDGWQQTGDIGVLDHQGFLSIVDRKRDMIISGGFNVYPGEIEQLLWGHPLIQDCAVIGVPDAKWGEQVTAIIELKDKQAKPDLQEVIAYCKKSLGSIKAPKEILIWDELPRSPVGKVLKKELRKVFWDKAGRKI